MSIKVTLEAGGEVLDLDEITANGEGVQAVAGLTGFGLPPVDVQWAEGAGDGARFRNSRAQARDIDLPLHVFVNDPNNATARVTLKSIVAKISRVVTQPMTLKFYDDEADPTAYKWCEVHRVGGGTYVYGGDTDGIREFNTILTIRAGSPFWTYDTQESASIAGTPQISTTLTVDNPGTTSAYPVWTVHGPLSTFRVTSPKGEVLEWNGRLAQGDTLTIDTQAATVVDQTGANRYSGLSVAPQMFQLPAGSSDVEVYTEQGTFVDLMRTNYSPYGTYSTSSHGFTPYDANTTVAVTGGKLVITPVIPSGKTIPDTQARASTTITGMPAGELLVARLDFSNVNKAATYWPPTIKFGTDDSVPNIEGIPLGQMGASIYYEFIVPDDGTLLIQVWGGGYQRPKHIEWLPVSIDNFSITQPGTVFTGDTPDTATYRYDWTGTPGQSTSTESLLTTPNGACALDLDFTPRDWQVI